MKDSSTNSNSSDGYYDYYDYYDSYSGSSSGNSSSNYSSSYYDDYDYYDSSSSSTSNSYSSGSYYTPNYYDDNYYYYSPNYYSPGYYYYDDYYYHRHHGGSSHDHGSDHYDNNFTFTGGNQGIENYTGQRIFIGALPTSMNPVGGNFYFYFPSGTLTIGNARDKVIDFRNANDGGSELAKGYVATNPMVIDLRGSAGVQYLVGSEAGSNTIYAGNQSAYLWGNTGNAGDFLVGGAGYDTFYVGRFEGNDAIQNATAADTVKLYDVRLSDIIFTAENNGVLGIALNSGNTITVQSPDFISAKISLADGTNWRFNHQTKSWQGA